MNITTGIGIEWQKEMFFSEINITGAEELSRMRVFVV